MDILFQLFSYFNTYSYLPPVLKKISFPGYGRTGAPSPPNREEIIEKRTNLIGSKCQTFYQKNPLIVSRASMQYLYDEKGERFLDCISNVQHVGHCHPKVVQGIAQQLAISTCNLRFLSQCLTECAEAIIRTLPSSLNTIIFCNSGSEANDVALQLARDFTGKKDVVVLENAYHGHITTTMEMSPYKFEHHATIKRPEWVHVAPAPDVYRGKYRLEDEELGDSQKLSEAGQRYSNDVAELLEREGQKVAAFIAEALQSCGGQVLPPPGYFRDVASHMHTRGGLMIIDEVQTGFGRVGKTFWAHQIDDGSEGSVIPDILTMGKPMGNGFPVSAVVTRKEITDAHCGASTGYFNTYGGNPVACAAVLGVLQVIDEERLLEHSEQMSQLFEFELRNLQQKHQCIGDIRGVGMFWGIDLVKDRRTREPDSELASTLVLKLRQEHNILLSADGPHANVIKYKPPLCFDAENLKQSVKAIDAVLTELTSPPVNSADEEEK